MIRWFTFAMMLIGCRSAITTPDKVDDAVVLQDADGDGYFEDEMGTLTMRWVLWRRGGYFDEEMGTLEKTVSYSAPYRLGKF